MQFYYDKILSSATEVCNATLQNAAAEAVKANYGVSKISAAFNGTWQKRGHRALNGVITITSFDTGKVLGFKCLSKFRII